MDQQDRGPFAFPSAVDLMTRGIVPAEPGLKDDTTTHDGHTRDMGHCVSQEQEEPELDHDEIRREGAAGTSATPWIVVMVPSIVATAFGLASLNACTSPAQDGQRASGLHDTPVREKQLSAGEGDEVGLAA